MSITYCECVFVALGILSVCAIFLHINHLKPNDIYIYIYIYICRTTALTSRRYILNIHSTNIHTEYFKRAL